MKEYNIGIAIEEKVVKVKAKSLGEAKSEVWESLSREQKDSHTISYEVGV